MNAPLQNERTSHNYFVVMQDYGKRGLEAIVDPEITSREVVSRIRSGEYKNIAFIHYVTISSDGMSHVADATAELTGQAATLQAAE